MHFYLRESELLPMKKYVSILEKGASTVQCPNSWSNSISYYKQSERVNVRKLVFGINVTADGFCDHHLGIPDEEMVGYFARLMRESDTLLYGRTTYELMFPYWPDIAKAGSGKSRADNEFAQAFAAVPKVAVVSRTLTPPGAGNVTVIRENLESEVLRLKKEPGRSISTGGVTLPSALLDLGLIDEFHLVIHPTMAGQGRRLFDGANLKEKIDLQLIGSRVFKSGIVALHYSKR